MPRFEPGNIIQVQIKTQIFIILIKALVYPPFGSTPEDADLLAQYKFRAEDGSEGQGYCGDLDSTSELVEDQELARILYFG